MRESVHRSRHESREVGSASPASPIAVGLGRRACWFLVGLAALTIVGCATTWTPRAEAPAATQQWPPAPAPARVTYGRSIVGFARAPGAGSIARAVLFGADEAGRDAFGLPVAAVEGRDGRLAVADLGRRCVHLYFPQGQRYLRLVGPSAEPMVSPVSVAFDDELHLYVSDSTGRLLSFGPDGAFLAEWRHAGGTALQRPTGLAWSRARKLLYVVDTLAHTIYALDGKGALARSIGGRGESAGSFNFPTHIAWSPRGELYVTDALNFRVQILDEDGQVRGTFGRHGDGSGDLAMPKGIAVDADGVVYLADSLFDNVQLFDREGRYLLTVGGRGVGLGELWLPAGLSISDRGDLYVCDSYNRRVQVFHLTEREADATP